MSRTCKVCGNTENNKIVTGIEMMFQTREEFEYLDCGKCGCMQIVEIPANLAKYYPDDYYSFDSKITIPPTSGLKYSLSSKTLSHQVVQPNFIGAILSLKYKNPFPWLPKRKLTFDSKIMDLGSGAGHTLIELYGRGFRNLTGIDPFISQTIRYAEGLEIRKQRLNDVNEQYDFIMLHHSFEHMDDPLGVLKEIYRVLKPDSLALIRIPVANCYAYEKYGENWVAFDAPRHLFLHTERSMRVLADQSGLELKEVVFDSTDFQFWASEMYKKKIPLAEAVKTYKQHFTEKQLESFRAVARTLNERKEGDSACFYFYKK